MWPTYEPTYIAHTILITRTKYRTSLHLAPTTKVPPHTHVLLIHTIFICYGNIVGAHVFVAKTTGWHPLLLICP